MLNEYLEVGLGTDNLRCICDRRALFCENLTQRLKHITALSHRLPHEANLRVVIILDLMKVVRVYSLDLIHQAVNFVDLLSVFFLA